MVVGTQPSPRRTMFRVTERTLLLYLCVVASITQTLWFNWNSTAFEGGGSDPQDSDQSPFVTALADFVVATARDKERTVESSNTTTNTSNTNSTSTDSKQSTDSEPSTEEPSSSSSEEEQEVILEQYVVSPFVKSNSTNYETSTREDNSAPSCAILFFGLPRSFKLFVLPSIIENIIVPNIDNNCDYYLHYHAVTSEVGSRGVAGGTIQGNDVFLLEDAVRQIHERDNSTGNSIPHVSITNSTMEEFEQARNQTMNRYETTLDENGEYLYYPYNALSWEYPQTMRNMVKQWHSINAVFEHMEENARILKRNYSRVAMLRNDVMYVTPLDVYQLSTRERDVDNNHFVIPDWANYPINDRMVAGPYDAVKIWATERFQRVERHVRTYPIPGWGVHSERFLNFSIVPAMLNASGHSSSSYVMDQNPNVCFLRARADGSVWIEDCQESFHFNMAHVVHQLVAKYHGIANHSNDGGVNCTKKSIKGIKYQDIMSCKGDVTFSVP